MTREFQEHCARLALGRPSTPSLAPSDTRIPVRPSTGSTDRRTIAVGTDPVLRPTTAPIRPHSYGTADLAKTLPAQNVADLKNKSQNHNWVNKDNTDECTQPKVETVKGKNLLSENKTSEKSTDSAKAEINRHSKQIDSRKDDSEKPADKQRQPKIVNQGIGGPGLLREFTMVEMPLRGKTQEDSMKVAREKTYITDKADLKVKQSEKNAAVRKSRLDALLEQTVELVEDALNCEDREPSEISISETIVLKERVKRALRSRSEDTRQSAGRTENARQRSLRYDNLRKSLKSDDPRQRSLKGKREEGPQRRKVDQAREKLRQNTKKKVDRQEIDTKTRKPIRRMIWNQNPGQPYKDDLRERSRSQRLQNIRNERPADVRQSSAPPVVVPPPSSALRLQEKSELQRSRGASATAQLESVKERAAVRRSQSLTRERKSELSQSLAREKSAEVSQSVTRERSSEVRHRSSRSDRHQQPHHEPRIGSSKSSKSQFSQDSDKSRPVVMLFEGDDPSNYRSLQFDMTRAARSMDIANSIDFSGKASKLRGSPYLEYTPLVMGKPRKQRSASLNRSQQR